MEKWMHKGYSPEGGKIYQTGLSESHRPDLHPNGKIVKCIKDKSNGFLIVKTDENAELNTWLVQEKHLTEIKKMNSLK